MRMRMARGGVEVEASVEEVEGVMFLVRLAAVCFVVEWVLEGGSDILVWVLETVDGRD